MESEMEKQLKQQFKLDALNRITGINHTFDELVKNFQAAAKLPMFRSMRFHQLTLNRSAYKNDVRQLELYFLEWIQQDKELSQISYFNTKGLETLRVERKGIKQNLTDMSHDEMMNDILKLNSGESRITLSRRGNKVEKITWWIPVFIGNNKHYGILGFSISYQYIMDTINELAKSDAEYVCLDDMMRIAVIKNNQCGQQNADSWQFTGKLSLANLPWWITLSVNPETFQTEVRYLRFLIFFVIFPIVAINAFMFSTFFFNQIIQVINKLVEAARVIGKGEWLEPVVVNRDDELGELAKEINRSAVMVENSRNELEQKNRDLDSYSYTLAHDLRAPLRSISSFSQILEMDAREKLAGDELDALARIIKASQRMSALIDDILELSRISNRDVDVKSLSLSHLAQSIIKQIKEVDSERDVKFDIEEGIIVKGDPQLLRLVLENLLGNAWKYSQKTEHAIIKFGSMQQTNNNKSITVYYIQDNGTGFDMQYVDKLFKPFQRLHKDSDYEGTGIGLASVKRMIERHEGRVWIDSALNKGTTIYFTLWEWPEDSVLEHEMPLID